MKFQKNVPLKKYTTFKIGGPAKYFFIAKTKEQLIEAVQKARASGSAFFILGGGSNLLVSSKGFKGLVVKVQNTKYKIQNTKIYAEAGTKLSQLVGSAQKRGLTGLEWAAGIPGTVGGAIFGNAGAFGKSMQDIVEAVEVSDAKTNIVKKIKNKGCRFGYRQSFFKKNRHLVILSCKIKLKRGDRHDIKKEIKGYLDYRQDNHPKKPSAGSIFTNPKGYAARELIDICGLRGKKIGRAQISNKHSNFIVNLGNAQAKDVLKLINLVKRKVKNKFGIKLEEEIREIR